MEWLTVLLTVLGNIVVAVVAIIPTIIANRKKTQDSIAESNKATDKQIGEIKKAFDDHVEDYEAAKAASQRYRILRFYDEVVSKQKHSESHFEDILDDIDEYEIYCKAHPKFKNNRGHAAMEYIKQIYDDVKAKGGFLTHE